MSHYTPNPQLNLLLRGEDRSYPVFIRCPRCECLGAQIVNAGDHFDRYYRVECTNLPCRYSTGPQKSSEAALRIFNLEAKLAQL